MSFSEKQHLESFTSGLVDYSVDLKILGFPPNIWSFVMMEILYSIKKQTNLLHKIFTQDK